MRYTRWKCKVCGDNFITDNKARWDMVWCKCKKTAVDDEELYARFVGDPILLAQSDNLKDLEDEDNS